MSSTTTSARRSPIRIAGWRTSTRRRSSSGSTRRTPSPSSTSTRCRMRDALKKRITELWNYPKVTRAALRGPALVLQPQHRPAAAVGRVHARDAERAGDGRARSEQPVAGRRRSRCPGFVPAPDAQHFAYGQSEGGSDWSTVLRARARHRQAAARRDSLGEVQQPVVDRRTARASSTAAIPSRGRARRSRTR